MIDLNTFFHKQLPLWPLAQANYDNQAQALVKDIFLAPHERIRLLCLPARIASSSAKITAKGEVDRPCFLCSHRLPPEQMKLDVGDFHILVNPFPVFPQHFTLPSKQHRRQAILPVKEDFYHFLMEVSEDFVIFFNAALCGASAPDHLHFQMGQKALMPLQADGIDSRHLYPVLTYPQVQVYELQEYSRQAWLIKSTDSQFSALALEGLCQAFEESESSRADEAGHYAQGASSLAQDKINVIAWRDDGIISTLVFPRAAHRPSCFFAENEQDRIVSSPASVEMMGYYIFPRQEDFHKADAELLRRIYSEVSLSPERVRVVSNIFSEHFSVERFG